VRLRLATFNLENLDDPPAGGLTLEDRIAALRPVLRRLDADVLCLQEVNAQGRKPRSLAALDALLETTPYARFHRAVTLNDAGTDIRDVQNLVTLSRFPLAEVRQVRHELVAPLAVDAAAGTGWDRPFLYCRLTLPGSVGAGPRALHVINLHLRSPLPVHLEGAKAAPFVWNSTSAWAEGFFLAGIRRNGQALEVRLFVDRLFDAEPDARIAVCGDFNAADREVPVATIRADVEDTGNPALASRVLATLDTAIPEAERYTVIHGGRRAMLDHVLASPVLASALSGIEAHNALLGDELIAYLMDVHAPGSFHAPVLAAFDLPE
jgi:endonuclease/exonuclease/phosphatase family metal-dependent hydrolase